MQEDQKTDRAGQEERDLNGRRLRLLAIVLVAVVVVFLSGFLPMWIRANALGKERDEMEQKVRSSQIQLTLADAAIDARRGEYEQARLAAITFFQSLGEELERPDSALALPRREDLQQLAVQRDDLITLLARSDPASAERLASFYIAFRDVAGR
jgi:hypothetical protein